MFWVVTGVNINGNWSCGTAINGQFTQELESLMSNIKEADQRLIIHNKWCAGKNQQNFLFVSNDTDVLVHLIHYYQMFHDLGAAKLWIGVGPKKPAAHFSAHTNCRYARFSSKGSSGSILRHWLS